MIVCLISSLFRSVDNRSFNPFRYSGLAFLNLYFLSSDPALGLKVLASFMLKASLREVSALLAFILLIESNMWPALDIVCFTCIIARL